MHDKIYKPASWCCRLVPDLFNALVHYLPLKAKAKNTGGKTKAQVASSAATQGKGGKRPGSDQLDLQWNLAKELRHGLSKHMMHAQL